MVEFVNRVFTGVGLDRRHPGRLSGHFYASHGVVILTWLSFGLVAGVIAQIVLGGITVLTDLHPAAVQAHFVLSIVILWDAVVLHQRAGEGRGGPYEPTVAAWLRHWALGLAVWGVVVIVTGTVVTGSGPHGGDEDAAAVVALAAIGDVARVHGITVILLLAGTLWLDLPSATAGGVWATLGGSLTVLVWAIVLQGALGYVQYFAGVPAACSCWLTCSGPWWCGSPCSGWVSPRGSRWVSPKRPPATDSEPSLAATSKNSAIVSRRSGPPASPRRCAPPPDRRGRSTPPCRRRSRGRWPAELVHADVLLALEPRRALGAQRAQPGRRVAVEEHRVGLRGADDGASSSCRAPATRRTTPCGCPSARPRRPGRRRPPSTGRR